MSKRRSHNAAFKARVARVARVALKGERRSRAGAVKIKVGADMLWLTAKVGDEGTRMARPRVENFLIHVI